MAPSFTASAQCKKAESSCCKKNTDACCKDAKQEGVYTQDYSNDPKLVKAAQKWYKKGKWRNGFKKADAHSSVNLVDFYLQYQKNPEQWKALFDFIAKTDLLAIPVHQSSRRQDDGVGEYGCRVRGKGQERAADRC